MFKHLTLTSGVGDQSDHIGGTMFDNQIKYYRTENIYYLTNLLSAECRYKVMTINYL